MKDDFAPQKTLKDCLRYWLSCYSSKKNDICDNQPNHPQSTKTSENSPQSAKTSQNHLKLSQTSQNHLKPPKTSQNHPQPPKTTHNQPKLRTKF